MYYDTMKIKHRVFYPEFDVLIKKQRGKQHEGIVDRHFND